MNDMIPRVHYILCCLAFPIPVAAGTLYVDVEATGQNNGMSWTDAYGSLSTAIGKAAVGDEVWVAEGTYQPITLKSGVKVIGGFKGTETSELASDPDTHKTYISGGGKSRALGSVANDSSTVLRGFYIIEGFVDFPDNGGGLYVGDSDTNFVRCVFTGNRSAVMGGAVAIWGGSPTFVNCRFYDNDGGWAAGAIFNRKFATPTFVNCLFYENKAWEGGAVGITTGAATFVNCTLSDNEATIGKGGALFDSRGEAVLRNCIIWGNVAGTEDTNEVFNLPAARTSTTVSYSNVKGGWPGKGNIGSDPLFVDAGKGDYRLQETSPCRDAGKYASLPADVADINADGNTTGVLPKDLALKGRVSGEAVDMGAFEWHPSGE